MRKEIEHSIQEVIRAAKVLEEEMTISFLLRAAEAMIESLENGGKLLIAGNGGSLADAMHFAEELTGYYREKRPPLAAIALADPCHMSCVSNDASFETIFSRLVEALGKPGDLLIVLTTSGNSKNILAAAKKAQELDIPVIGFLGKGGGGVKALCDLYWVVEGFTTSDRIQEAHMAAIHILIEMIEKGLFMSAPNEFVTNTFLPS